MFLAKQLNALKLLYREFLSRGQHPKPAVALGGLLFPLASLIVLDRDLALFSVVSPLMFSGIRPSDVASKAMGLVSSTGFSCVHRNSVGTISWYLDFALAWGGLSPDEFPLGMDFELATI